MIDTNLDPELNLWAAVINMAVSDLRNKRERSSAYRYLFKSKLFEEDCGWLGLDVEATRDRIRREMNGKKRYKTIRL